MVSEFSKDFPQGKPMPYRAEVEFYMDTAGEQLYAIQLFDWVYYPGFLPARQAAAGAVGKQVEAYRAEHPQVQTAKIKRVYPC